MDYIESYKDIKEGIEIHKIIIDSMENEIEVIKKMMYSGAPTDIAAIQYSGMPSGNFSPIPLDRLEERLNRLENRLNVEKATLDELVKKKNKIDDCINKFQGLKYKVAYRRFIQGKQLKIIADELGYSIDRIKQISAEIGKM